MSSFSIFYILGPFYFKPLNQISHKFVFREQVERDLTFLGFLVMENKLKPETTAVIQELKEADIRTIMVTGNVKRGQTWLFNSLD